MSLYLIGALVAFIIGTAELTYLETRNDEPFDLYVIVVMVALIFVLSLFSWLVVCIYVLSRASSLVRWASRALR